MTKLHIYIIGIGWMAMSCASWAQAPAANGDRWNRAAYTLADAQQLWRLTAQPAALTVDSGATRGMVSADFNHVSSTFHRVQEGGDANNLGFFTERYQPISSWLYGYGKFAFDMDHGRGKSFCDVQRPYDSDPFYSGSARSTSYDQWNVDLSAVLATRELGGFRYGVRLDYKIGDLTGLRDPRPRSEMVNYRVTPSVAYTLGEAESSHTFALSGHYDRYKEKIVSVSVVGETNYMYYLMSGLENAIGTLGGHTSFWRQWVNHKFGADLSWGYQSPRYSQVTSLGISRGSEDIYGRYKYEPGHYYEYQYRLSTMHRIQQNKRLHEIDFEAVLQQAYADEYHQELWSTTDPSTGYTSYGYETLITFNKRYQVKTGDYKLRYQLDFLDDNGVKGSAGLTARYEWGHNKHLLHESQLKYGRADFAANGSYAFGFGLTLDANLGYSVSTKADLDLFDPTTDIAVYVLLPDMQYYDSNYLHGGVKATYEFPFTFKGHARSWFVSAYFNGLHAKAGNKTEVGLTIGLFN